MPPIPIHLDDPLTPEKPQGVTPQTQPTNASSSNPPPTTTTTTAAAAPPPPPYPPAQPGAAPAPAPTGYVAPQPSRTIGQEQGNMNSSGNGDPPPPHPGAFPVPPSSTQQQQAPASALPPPPKAGEAAKMREAGCGTVTAMPAQMGVPAPQQGYGNTHSTTTATTGAPGPPTTMNLGPVSSQPAAGYQQNVFAQDLSSAQRASLEEQERRESLGAGVGGGGWGFGGAGGQQGSNGGMLGGAGGGGGIGGEGEGVWGAVKGWASGVGTKLAETEEEVWRRIGSKGH